MPSLSDLGKLALDYGPALIGPIAGGLINRNAAGDATRKLDEGAARAESVIQPYSDVGAQALAKLPNFGIEEMLKDPGLQFRINEGDKLFARKQASTGSLNSGAAWKAREMYRGNLLNQEFQNAWNRNMQQVAVGQEGSRQLVDLMTARASALAAGDIAKANALTDMISGIQGGIEGVMDFKKLQEMINGPNVTAPDSAYSRIPIPDPSSVGPITSTIAGLGGAAAAGTAAGLGGGAGVTGTIGATTFPNVLGAAGAVGSGGAAAAPGAIGAAGTTGSGGLLGAIGSTAGNVGTSVGTLGGLVPLAVGIPIIGGAIAAAIILPKLFGNGPDRMAANELTESGGLHDYIVEGINKLNADQSLTPEQKAETQEAIARQVEDYLVEFSKIDKHHYYQAKQTLIDMQWLGVKPLLGDPEAEFKAMIANLGDKLAPLGNRLREDLRRLI